MSSENVKVSFVIPCYNSSATVGGVVDEIKETCEKHDYTYEVVLVNDCSPDNTYEVIKDLAKNNPHVFGINLGKNFGQHGAIMAGLRKTTGTYVVCLDDDGQTPANEVDKLIGKLEEGSDAVFARYRNKMHNGFRNFGSRVNDHMAKVLIGKPKDLFLSSYVAMKRYVVDEILKYKNPYPYLSGLVLRTCKNITNADVHHRAREEGQSGYTFSKLIGLWLNGFTSFSVKPLRISSSIGVISASIGFLYAIYTIIHKFVHPEVQVGWSSLMSVNLILGGLILCVLGMVGEYIGRVYISLNNSPQYVIKETTYEDNKTEETGNNQ